MQKILIATKNKWKMNEITCALRWLNFEFMSLNDLNINDDIQENWITYEENAILKAKFFWELSKFPTIADDSWIIVEALEWELWVKTRRWWAWENASDEEWLGYFMNRMKNEENKRAHCFTSIAFYNKWEILTFNWDCAWTLLDEVNVELEKGIPLSAIFVPDWYSKPYSLLWVEEKNKIWHRWKASLKLREYLKEF